MPQGPELEAVSEAETEAEAEAKLAANGSRNRVLGLN